MVREIKGAQKNIDLLISLLTDDNLANGFVETSKWDVDVRSAFDKNWG